MKKTIAALLALLMIAIPLASCQPAESTATLVIATNKFEEKFNPFYAENAYDMEVMDQIFVSPQRINAKNVLEDWGGSIKAEEKQVDGKTHVIYTVTVKKGMKFSDGKAVDIDDVIYSYYVFADSGYSGPSRSWATSTSIVGLKEYYYDDPNYTSKIEAITKEADDKYSAEKISKEDFIAYLIDSNLDGWWDGDPAGEAGAGTTWVQYIKDSGYETQLNAIDATDATAMLELLALIEYETSASYYTDAAYSYYLDKLRKSYIAGNLEDGVDVEKISGIVRVDDYTCTVEFYDLDIYGDRNVNVSIVPAHYYGEFAKGQADKQLLKNLDKPMGSGPYVFVSVADNIVTAKANNSYFEGEPFIKNVKWQYIEDGALLTALKNNEVDIISPSASKKTIDDLKAINMAYSLVDNNGYGYLGINADNVDKLVRKGFMHLLSRSESVNGYYQDPSLATIIERPMTTTLGEYPHGAKEYYGYDTDKALEYFTEAGYALVDGELKKDGEKLVLNAYIGGSGKGDHPAYAMLIQAQNDMEEMGAELIINDVEFNVLQSAMNGGTADIFVLAWGASNTCDKSTIYKTDGGQNRTNISNARLDQLLDEIVKTIDFDKRSELVAESLDIVMDEAVEMPLYQRMNMIAYNPANVDSSTWPETSTYWTYANQLWKLKLVEKEESK